MPSLDAPDEIKQRMLKLFYDKTGGDSNRTAAMWPIGQEMGLDKVHTQDVAMDLVAEGWLEIKTLSGAMGLTDEGLAQVRGQGPEVQPPPSLAELMEKIEAGLADAELKPSVQADLRIDLDALALMSRRSRPLPGVIPALLKAILGALEGSPGFPKDIPAALKEIAAQGS